MSKQAVALIAGLLIAGLLVAGCGGDDSSDGSEGASAVETSSSEVATDGDGDGDGADGDGADVDTNTDSSATVSKAAFIKQADEICTANTREVTASARKLLEKSRNFESKDFQVEAVEVALAPQLTALLEDLEALGAPSGDEEQIEAIVANLEERADLANEDPEAFVEEEGRRGGSLYKEAQALAKQYGFEKCMQDPDRG